MLCKLSVCDWFLYFSPVWDTSKDNLTSPANPDAETYNYNHNNVENNNRIHYFYNNSQNNITSNIS